MGVNRAATNMSILASELARMAGPKCQETVSAAMKRWEEKIRERVRLEMALKLADDSGWGDRCSGLRSSCPMACPWLFSPTSVT